MSAWGGIDLEDSGENSPGPAEIEFDLESMLKKIQNNPEEAKTELQHLLIEAAQNGDDRLIVEILATDATANLVDINAKDAAGSTALIYASCFGHEQVVAELLRFNADPNIQDANEWSALMWAANNNHLTIVKQLLVADADTNLKTSSGRTIADLVSPTSATYLYLSSTGQLPSGKGGSEHADAFYEEALDPVEVENQFSAELKESAAALGGFGATSHFAGLADDDNETMDMSLGGGGTGNAGSGADFADLSAPLKDVGMEMMMDFDWDTFKVKDSFALPRELIPEYLDLVITKVVPTLRKDQQPMSANSLFMATRYFFYCGTTESFTAMTSPLARRIEMVVQDESHANDLAYLSYWLTNAEIYLYYLRKDKGLNEATKLDLQPTFESLVLVISHHIQTATQHLLDPLIVPCLLDYDSIPEYGKVEYRGEWKLFRSSAQKEENLEDVAQHRMMPRSHEAQWKNPGPQRVTSILSSLLLLFQIYGVHSVTQAQILARLIHYFVTRMFNKLVNHKRYLNRRRAMQIRLNTSVIEDWCRNHNFRPESVEIDNTVYRYKSLIDIGRTFMAPLNQILAWLQTFSGFGSDFTNVVSTLQELKALHPKQLLQTATHYRFETREAPLSKEYKSYLQDLSRHYDRAEEERKHQSSSSNAATANTNTTSSANHDLMDVDDTQPKRKIESCVLISYELPVSENVVMDENLRLVEHVPLYEESNEFWGDPDVSAVVANQGGRFVAPFVPTEIVEAVSKQIEEDELEEQQNMRKQSIPEDEDDDELKEPALASHKPVDGEEPDNIWADDDTLAPVW